MTNFFGALALVLLLPVAVPPSGGETSSAFFVSKSENRNQVHYAVRVDKACQPMGPAPVHAYWLMLEKGPRLTEPLLEREQAAYGVQRQHLEGSTVRLSIRSLPNREIAIQTWQGPDGQCRSTAVTTIAGTRARLFNVHVVLDGLKLGVSSVLLRGWRDDGSEVSERMRR
jgi:hypothetical protein